MINTGFINFHDITFMTPGWKQKADIKQAILTGVLKKRTRD